MPQSSRRILKSHIPNLHRFSERESHSRGHGIYLGALFAVPVIFVIMIGLLAYFAFAPIAGSYINMAMRFVGDYVVTEVPDAVNLMESPPPAPPLTSVTYAENENMASRDLGDMGYFIRWSDLTLPEIGDQYARLTVSGTTVDSPVFWGDSEPILNRGVGTFVGTWLPGFGRTTLLAGHRNTDFAGLQTIEIGAIITIETFYGIYAYEVVRTEVLHEDIAAEAVDFFRDDDNIILYTCYPFDWMGAARYRLFVFGDKVSGTPVDLFS
ncbi:MAG: class D sortase [Oscillospiraceae bacterium]|nr:class D sortase [Oscillospiraceae bacterium]